MVLMRGKVISVDGTKVTVSIPDRWKGVPMQAQAYLGDNSAGENQHVIVAEIGPDDLVVIAVQS